MANWQDYLSQIGQAAQGANASLTAPTTQYPQNPSAQPPNQLGSSLSNLVNGIKAGIQNHNMSKNNGNSAESDSGSNQAANTLSIPQWDPNSTTATNPSGMGATAPATDTSAPCHARRRGSEPLHQAPCCWRSTDTCAKGG